MTESNKYLDSLFEQARMEEASVSFQEVRLRFRESVTSGNIPAPSQIGSKISIIKFGVFFIGALVLISIVTSKLMQSYNGLLTESLEQPKTPTILDSDTSSTSPTSESENTEASNIENNEKSSLSAQDTMNLSVSKSTKKEVDQRKGSQDKERTKMDAIDSIDLIGNSEVNSSKSNNDSYDVTDFKMTFADVQETDPSIDEPISFTINNKTTTQKLSMISYQAKQAGVDYTYTVDLEKDLIRELNVFMFVPGTELECSVEVSVHDTEDFEVTFGWYADKSGKAYEFTDDIAYIKTPQKHALLISHARKISKLYVEEGIEFLKINFNRIVNENNLGKFEDNLLNSSGYQFLNQNEIERAIEIFSLNTNLFPDKENPWDSLGEAYYKSGDKERALRAFRKALSINPKFEPSQRWVDRILAER